MNELDSNEAVDRQVCNNKIATIAFLRADDGNQPRTKLIKDSEDFKYETPSCRVQKQILLWLPISLLVLHKMCFLQQQNNAFHPLFIEGIQPSSSEFGPKYGKHLFSILFFKLHSYNISIRLMN